ncbi:hypothetical protein G9A89_018867 [Geosiphon pyriformis]|nr:hypothetical protein G9A89_018867 [Geosiphon pyriformis]
MILIPENINNITQQLRNTLGNCKNSLRENSRQWVDFSSAFGKEYINTHNNQELRNNLNCNIKEKAFSITILRKAITKKQFLYLISAVLQPIISYRLQFSCTSSSVCKKWDRLLKKGLKLKANLPKNFLNEALYHLELYGLKTFEQVLAENLVANLIKFSNSAKILGDLFKHRAMDLQVACWMSRHPLWFPVKLSIDPLNCFLVGAICTLAFCNLSLGDVLPNVFQAGRGVMVVEVLGLDSYLSMKKLDPRSLVPAWFTLLVSFIEGGGLLHNRVVSFQLLSSGHYCDCGSVEKHLLSSVEIYIDGSVKDFGLVNICNGTAAYFPDVNLGIGVKINGLLSLTLVEMQAIALVLECIPNFFSVTLFTDSQALLNICKFDSSVPVSNFCRNCWIKKEHICQVIFRKHLSVNWQKVKGHSDVIKNKQADFFTDTATVTSFLLPLKIPYWFLTVEDRIVFGNAYCFVKSLFSAISFVKWESKCIDSIMNTDIGSGLDMARTLKI